MKKIISLLLIIVLLAAAVPGQAESGENQSGYYLEAEKLHSLGLMMGTGAGFELERVPQRVEAAVMLVRLLGSESEALLERYSHPFDDVPKWADPYVGFLFSKGLTKGVGGNLFDSYADVDARTYLTFLMRTLGYLDDAGDFKWDSAVNDAFKIGMISARERTILNEEIFTRGHMAAMSYNVLNTVIKNSNSTLVSELLEQGAVDKATVIAENFRLTAAPEQKFLRYLTDGEYIPYLIGIDVDTAKILMRKAGIVDLELVYKINEVVSENLIIDQSTPAYINSSGVDSCILTVSRGPSQLYQSKLMSICQDKDWDEEIIPYIIASAKYLIRNTVLSKYDIYKRLEDNLEDIVILSEEESAAFGVAAFYDSNSKNMYINRHVMNYDLILHELAHAISYNEDSGKTGFLNISGNTRRVTEAFVESIATKAAGVDIGYLNTFRFEDEKIVFSCPSYFSDGPGNYTLGVFGPLFILAGKNAVEKMYFRDVADYNIEVLKFNRKYGDQRWKILWEYADEFIDKTGSVTVSGQLAKAAVLRSYLDGIIECLYIDLSNVQNDDSNMRLLLFKTREIKKSFPLGYNRYREKMEILERKIISGITSTENIKETATNGSWIANDYSDKSPEYVFNSLTVEGDAKAIGYRVVKSDMINKEVVGVLYKEPGMAIEEAVEINKYDEYPLGGEYIILIPEKQPSESGVIIMRDLVKDFDKYLVDFNNISGYVVARLLRAEGIAFRYEFAYYDEVAPAMNGRIIGQFPEPGTVIVPGKTIIRIFMIRERR